MRGNFFKIGCRIEVEGVNIGSPISIETSEDRDSLVNTCSISIPLYALGYIPGVSTEDRLRVMMADAEIRPGARIDVYTFYHDDATTGNTFEEIHAFSGYIRQVIEGFPTTLLCEDHSFVLRFGTINRDWRSRTTVKQMVDYLTPISNEAFEQFRIRQGFQNPRDFIRLQYDTTDSAEAEFALQVFKNISPFDALSKLLKLFTLYGTVTNEGLVYFGIGVKDKFNRVVELSTATNVIDRNIVTRQGLFENYKVVVNGLVGGQRYTYELGDSEAQPEKLFSPLNSVTGIQQFARSVMNKLKGDRNSGTITTLMYPVVNMFDYVQYTDTVFDSYSGLYYVIGRTFTLDSGGSRQVLTTTDQSFIL